MAAVRDKKTSRTTMFYRPGNVTSKKKFIETQCMQISGDASWGVFLPFVQQTVPDGIGGLRKEWGVGNVSNEKETGGGTSSANNDFGGLRKVEVGVRDVFNVGVKNKVILFVGETGVGKSSAINSLANVMMGVKFEDPFRIKLVNETDNNSASSQTCWITSYTLHHQPWFRYKYNLTIIDTPGLGDTRGVTVDMEIKQQIDKFFRTKGKMGIDQLDAVAFLIKASDARLTVKQKYIFDSVLGVFGKDIAENIVVFYTFTDSSTAKALAAVKEASIPYAANFKFNFGEMFNLKQNDKAEINGDDSGSDDDGPSMAEPNWKKSEKYFDRLFKALNGFPPKSLTLSLQVLDLRNHLEDALNSLQENANISINELQWFKDQLQVMERCKDDLQKRRRESFETLEQYITKDALSPEYTAVNCSICKVTCLKTKFRWTNENLRECWLFRDAEGLAETRGCRKCPKSCHHGNHQCEKEIFTIRTRKVTRTVDDLIRYYEEEGRAMTADQIYKECKRRIDLVERETRESIRKATDCIRRLNHIALKPHTMSVTDYIDMLIATESKEADAELQKRESILKNLKKKEEKKEELVKRESEDVTGMDAHDIPVRGGMNMVHHVQLEKKTEKNFVGKLVRKFKKWVTD